VTEREMLEGKVAWLRQTIIDYENTPLNRLPISWRNDSIKRTLAQIADVEWRLSFEPPHPAPLCGCKTSYSEHPWPCPKNDKRCNAQMGIKSKRVSKGFAKVNDVETS